MIPDEVDDTLAESSGPVEAIPVIDREVKKTTDKSGGGQTLKKNQAHQHSGKASSGTWDRPVSYD